jgi:homoserine kinase type II
MDLAIVLNDWCFNTQGALDALLAKHLIKAYQNIRPLQKVEQQLFNTVLRAAALRFWILRLDLKYNPRTRYNEQCSDSGNDYNPDEYRDKLLTHIRQKYEIMF